MESFLNEYIDKLSAGAVPQAHVDKVETLYVENCCYSQRKDAVDVIGNPCVDFGYYVVHQCFECLKDLINGKSNCQQCAEAFVELFGMVDEDEYDFFEDTPNVCAMLFGKEISEQEFIDRIKLIYTALKKNYNIL